MPPELAATIAGRTGKSEAVVMFKKFTLCVQKLLNVRSDTSINIPLHKFSNEKICLHVENEEEADCS